MSQLEVDGRQIELSKTDKVFFPDDGLTKGELIDYYRYVADIMVPHVANRPLTLQRFPDGIDKEGFFQQQRSDYFPDWIDTVKTERAGSSGESDHVEHVLCNDAATLVYLADQAAITLHGWLARAPKLEHPDRLIFDLDPPGSAFEPVRKAARQVAKLMDRIGLTPHVMTSGSRGLHVVAPLKRELNFDDTRELAREMADYLADENPDELTTQHYKNKRRGRLYLDIMRNAYGQTTVMPYAVRAKPGAPIATPLDLDELSDSKLGAQRYRLGNIRNRLRQKADPWQHIERHAANPETAAKRLAKLR